jgi:phage baseplate assembly protein W
MELYIKSFGDPNYNAEDIVIENEVEMLMSQIEVILFTNKGEVLGNPDLGCNLEDLLYTFNFNNHKIKTLIQDQIAIYCPLSRKYPVEVDVVFQRGEVRDVAYIDILVNNKYLISVNA